MTSLSEIDLKTTGSTVFLLLLLMAALVFSYLVYRQTVPVVSKRIRLLLMTLRAAAALLIILLLFEPVLSVVFKKQEKPLVAVLVDRSASMGLVDQKVDRRHELQAVLNSELFSKESSDFEMVFYPFSYRLFDGLDAPPDSLSLSDDGTDIRTALQELKDQLAERYFAAAILITDGANNLGENPVRYAVNYGAPIYPIAIGDPHEQQDILISNYATNEVVYAGTKVPVDVYIKNSGFRHERISVNLSQGNKTFDSQIIPLSGDGLEQKVRLYFTPNEEGRFKFEIKLPQLAGELTHLNNSKVFYVNVLKSKLKLLIIAGGPDPDFSFLKRGLAADENIEVYSFVEKFKGQFYERATLPALAELSKYDCLILLDYPRRTSSRDSIDKIKALLANGKPVLYLIGRNVDFDKLMQWKDFTPLRDKPIRSSERPAYFQILPQEAQHPVTRLSEDELENRLKWQELPPVFTNLSSLMLNPAAQSLAALDLARSDGPQRQNLPLMATQNSGKRKSVAVFAYGLWRWDLLMTGVGKTSESYQRFFRNSVRWLVSQEESKLVRISTNKDIYRSGEPVRFTAQVYYEDLKPVEGADVSVQVTGPKETQELALNAIGEGRYDGTLQVLSGGDYEFTGTAHFQGRVLGRDSDKFSIEPFNLEYQYTRMNEELLKRLAAESGGAFFTTSNFDALKDNLRFPEKYQIIKSEWQIWNKIPLLITCVLLLSAEWFIRKRKGML